LKGLSRVQSHTEEKSHSAALMNSTSSNCIYAAGKNGCDPCGIMFSNEFASESHKLMPPHGSSSSSSSSVIGACLKKFPKLVNVIRQLNASPLAMDDLLQDFPREAGASCAPCNVMHDGVEEFLHHMSEQRHTLGLRSSMCILCDKTFIASSDREMYLAWTNHRLNLQKLSNHVEKATAAMGLKKGGYACMYCMVYCYSWQCWEQHLTGEHHGSVYSEKKIKHARLEHYRSLMNIRVMLPLQGNGKSGCKKK
jgi:hypothetical protein